MGNKGLLTIVVVLLLGILTVLVIQMNKKTPVESLSDSVSEAVEEVGDEIDDHTTSPN